ncbi:MAG: glycosyltransferase family 2 protein [Shimia sp.]
MSARITVATATMTHRLGGLSLPPPDGDICHHIFVQGPAVQDAGTEAGGTGTGPLPAEIAERGDVTVFPLPSLGLSHSRNAALEAAQTPLLLFADDDMLLDPAGIGALADALMARPRWTIAAGWRRDRFTSQARRARAHRLSVFTSGRVCAPEFMVRMADIRRLGVRFDPDFGVGAPHPVGEDFIFLCDLLRAGARGGSVPIVTGEHRGDSSGLRWDDPALIEARAVVLQRVFGRMTAPVRMAYTLRHRRRFPSPHAARAFALGRPQPDRPL